MRWEPPASARIAGFLLSLCAGLALGRAAPAAGARDLGILGPFYRATQLQGHLIGMGLIEIPAYLTASDIDLKYRAKPGTSREIPFADSFTINRSSAVTTAFRRIPRHRMKCLEMLGILDLR